MPCHPHHDPCACFCINLYLFIRTFSTLDLFWHLLIIIITIFMGNQQSFPYESSLTRTRVGPTHSHSLQRSRSIRSQLEEPHAPAEKSYLPKGMERAHRNLERPLPSHGEPLPSNSGVESPLWGWYINTTPPTPEMYHSRSSGKQHISATTPSMPTSVPVSASAPMPNLVFQGLQDKNREALTAFPTVPL